MVEKIYDDHSRVDRAGNIWTGTKSRCAHFDWLKDAEIGGHYELCGEDNILISIKNNVFTFEEEGYPVDGDGYTRIEFIGRETYLKYESLILFEEMSATERGYLDRAMKERK